MFTDRNGNVWPNREFYDFGCIRFIVEDLKTMNDYFVQEFDGGWWVYWK